MVLALKKVQTVHLQCLALSLKEHPWNRMTEMTHYRCLNLEASLGNRLSAFKHTAKRKAGGSFFLESAFVSQGIQSHHIHKLWQCSSPGQTVAFGYWPE